VREAVDYPDPIYNYVDEEERLFNDDDDRNMKTPFQLQTPNTYATPNPTSMYLGQSMNDIFSPYSPIKQKMSSPKYTMTPGYMSSSLGQYSP